MYPRVAIAILACFLATAAFAQPILPGGGSAQPPQKTDLQRVTADEVAKIIKELNSSLEVTTTKLGDKPALRINGWRGFIVGIAFYGCKTEGCDSMQILTTGTAPSHVDLKYVNNWNNKWRYTKLYLDDQKDYHLDMDVVCEGGVTKANVVANLQTYDWFLVELSGGKHN
jgi:Putative bacterial sensory transduction regulator